VPAIAEFESYTKDVSFEDFLQNSMMRFACFKQLEMIREAANYISGFTRKKFIDVNWEER